VTPHRASTPRTGTPTPERKARLIYAKSHVAIHPTQLKRDNISGLLGLVEVDRDAAAPRVPDSAPRSARGGNADKEVLVVWVPDELLQRMPEEDKRNYQRVEERPNGTPTEEDGECCVPLAYVHSCGAPLGIQKVEVRLEAVLRPELVLTPGFVFVSLPPPRGEKYAFSVPVSNIYSILVYPVGNSLK